MEQVLRNEVGQPGQVEILRTTLAIAALTLAYFVTAKFGIDLPVAEGVITPVWIPTGLSIVAVYLFGFRVLPGVAIGAFTVNATSGVSLAIAAAIALGNTSEAFCGVYILRRFGFRPSLDTVRHVLTFVGAAVTSTAVAATVGVTTLWVAGNVAWGEYRSHWVLWWFGDTIGALTVASLLFVGLATLARRPQRPSTPVLFEALLLLTLLTATNAIVFLGGQWEYPYVLFPLLTWAVLRFKVLGAVISSFLMTGISVWGTVHGSVPIPQVDSTQAVQILQALTTIVAISMLVLAASIAEREAAQGALHSRDSDIARNQLQAERRIRESLRRLDEAQRIAHIGSWDWNIEADTVTWSDELYRVYGVEPTAALTTYESYLGLIYPDDREAARQTVQDALARRSSFSFEHRLLHPDGLRTVRADGATICDDDGNAVRMVGTSQDVTERKRTEEYFKIEHDVTRVLADARTLDDARPNLLAALAKGLNAAAAAFWEVDNRDDVLRCWATWYRPDVDLGEFAYDLERTTFLRGEALPGRVWESGTTEWTSVPVTGAEPIHRGQRSDTVLHSLIGIPLTSDGETLGVIEFFDERPRNPDGQFLDMLRSIGTQISHYLRRKEAEGAAQRVKEEFFASVSHELRTPLSAIVGYLDLLAEEEVRFLSSPSRRFVDVMQRNCQRLMRLVDDLLFAAQIDSGTTMALLKHPMDLRAVVQEAYESAEPSALAKHINLELSVTDPIPGLIGDRDRIAQVLDNLISNAIKFTPNHGYVTVRLMPENGTVVLEVEDTGVGIPEEIQPQLFRRFERGSAALMFSGVGLGLAIAKAIVDGHGGTISFNSREGEGATFRVELPSTVADIRTDDRSLRGKTA